MKVKKITKPELEGDTYLIAQAVNHNAELLENVLDRIKELEKVEKAASQQECIHVIENTDCELSPQVWKEISNYKMSLLPATPKQEPILDKSISEIDKQEKWLSEAGYNAYNVGIAFFAIKHALGKLGQDTTRKSTRLERC